MKPLLYASVFLFVGACATQSYKEKMQDIEDAITIVDPDLVTNYANSITAEELKTHLYIFASDDFEGRETGSKGQKLAADFIKRYYINEQIASPANANTYYQHIPASYFGNNYNSTENVLAFIPGNDRSQDVIVISAHYDHEGRDENGNIYYGADDDGSGTVAILEIAQAFKKAKADGNGPRRSILFLHTTAEEVGLQGSRYYTENPVFPLENTIANLNIDMIGRVDKYHADPENSDYVYLIGSDRLSTELHFISEVVNDHFYDLKLNYKYNSDDDQNRYYERSDHYNFAKKNIPVIFYFNGEHEDYHKITDTPDKINYELLAKRAKLIFATAWQLANQEKRIVADKAR
ncbi:MAG: M20/M25/M40 family metallo-hydrolase [Flavobacteriaceae bacterium]|nr:M20/M25/M40 family metallo-hydrolase [Flavobacteriaceae bacterium]